MPASLITASRPRIDRSQFLQSFGQSEKMLIGRANSATGGPSRQVSLIAWLVRENIRLARTRFDAAFTRPQKPVKFRMRFGGLLNLAAIARTPRPMAAVSLSVSADMIAKRNLAGARATKAQTGVRRIDVHQARSGSSEIAAG
jgi:hypothetical protein